MLWVSIREEARYHDRGDRSQSADDLPRFIKRPHMRIAGREKPIGAHQNPALARQPSFAIEHYNRSLRLADARRIDAASTGSLALNPSFAPRLGMERQTTELCRAT